ncbi:hypothetical protein SAY87_023224 [Trapa incisa]|uniref:Uncharacterized protein n=1 Tax=Trapa incisa TaxID=236973 RepID=A0AAN7K270_9MYRT|nr:hypothetical protein SAY87_023224 [Trapa incisa]
MHHTAKILFSSLAQITGRLLPCQTKYVKPPEAFSEILMKNRKSIDIVTHKNHTEVGAAGSESDGGSPSNGTTNSSFSFEGGEQKISRPG